MCYNPITIKTPDGYKQVPCGHCLECLKKYQADWTNRMTEELKAHNGKAVFFTLTYNDETVPKNYIYDYEVYRSKTDYAYSNAECVSTGKRKLGHKWKSRVNGERIKFRELPWQSLIDLGLDLPDQVRVMDGEKPHILDFNIQRNNHEKFIENVQRIYGDYIRTVCDTLPVSYSNGGVSIDYQAMENWFENYEGDLFTFDDLDTLTDAFSDILNDDSYMANDNAVGTVDVSYGNDSVLTPVEEASSTTLRERPIMSFNSVRKEDVQNWIKRGRRKLQRTLGKNFTFFITSEYGPRTLRPHYHGVLFGVDASEVQFMFSDWIRHYGFVKFENVDLSKGDMSYCAKYCAKGMYEHPLCTKDFFYTYEDGHTTEYHSKHYERCMEIFGMDEPIVDPTFKLVSKHLGESYVDNNKSWLIGDMDDIDFYTDTTKATVHPVLDALLPWEDGYEDRKEDKDLIVKNNSIKGKDYEKCIAELFDRFKYKRVIGKEVVSYGMPKYYRAKVFSEGLRSAFAGYVQQVNVEVYQQKLAAFQTEHPDWRDTEIVLALEEQERREKEERKMKTTRYFQKYLNKSKI